MKINRKNHRGKKITCKKIRRAMEKHRVDATRISKWLKKIESKKNIFAIEDEIEILAKKLKAK
jgi:hypothetical protein